MSEDLRSAPVPPVGPQDHVRGPEDAPVVVLYADFTCPRCALAWERIEGAPLRLVFRHLALKAKHPRAVALACAVEAAARQDRFWALAASLYADPGRTDDPHLWARCPELGIDLDRFEADRRDPAVLDRVRADVRAGLRAGVTVTPTFFAGAEAHPGPPDAPTVARWTAGPGHPADR
ncbi:MAG: oxidoreductase [Solirubrobacterales bacterium]|nr:oxidoreductase [Solirubrobacterales bacterium]